MRTARSSASALSNPPHRAPRRAGRGGVGLALLCLGLGALSAGCVVVKPYQREQLAERCMQSGFGNPSEARFRSHWEGSRSGLEGGYGEASGGCGCN